MPTTPNMTATITPVIPMNKPTIWWNWRLEGRRLRAVLAVALAQGRRLRAVGLAQQEQLVESGLKLADVGSEAADVGLGGKVGQRRGRQARHQILGERLVGLLTEPSVEARAIFFGHSRHLSRWVWDGHEPYAASVQPQNELGGPMNDPEAEPG